ncbi:hypothetical protein M011DRAFT_351443 [Sporormia fimetaria CBS 119925]|uniref:Uncharacterized protein n=1 Tax=Sporormia fimetaria CBS 119925 TaxID=1340428 RepID=A0A6A6VG23_9PLEO|nr:hypothetical protein M011DRAFT_351443 [Sporormia fimetaria CBS 119925]
MSERKGSCSCRVSRNCRYSTQESNMRGGRFERAEEATQERMMSVVAGGARAGSGSPRQKSLDSSPIARVNMYRGFLRRRHPAGFAAVQQAQRRFSVSDAARERQRGDCLERREFGGANTSNSPPRKGKTRFSRRSSASRKRKPRSGALGPEPLFIILVTS